MALPDRTLEHAVRVYEEPISGLPRDRSEHPPGNRLLLLLHGLRQLGALQQPPCTAPGRARIAARSVRVAAAELWQEGDVVFMTKRGRRSILATSSRRHGLLEPCGLERRTFHLGRCAAGVLLAEQVPATTVQRVLTPPTRHDRRRLQPPIPERVPGGVRGDGARDRRQAGPGPVHEHHAFYTVGYRKTKGRRRIDPPPSDFRLVLRLFKGCLAGHDPATSCSTDRRSAD